ncbi:MAG: hypothetical protein WBI48_04035, partial [Thermacetogeniaceae bacterium]
SSDQVDQIQKIMGGSLSLINWISFELTFAILVLERARLKSLLRLRILRYRSKLKGCLGFI